MRAGDRPAARARAASVLLRAVLGVVALLGVSLSGATILHAAAEAQPGVVFRVFLLDGTAISSYGEFAQAGDRVVFAMPLGRVGTEPRLHLVNIPASSVDWAATTRYAESARSAHYAATRGEADFALMSSAVARALNEIALTADAARRLQIAEGARRTLAEWPLSHHGYRAGEVRQMLGLLDEAIQELRALAGYQEFDLSLVAADMAPAQAAMPPLPESSPAQVIQEALAVAGLTGVPAERISLFHTVLAFMDESVGALPSAWAAKTRASVAARLAGELAAERAYADLSRRLLGFAEARAARGDVRGVQAVVDETWRRDAALGRKRPDTIHALLLALEGKLDAARRLRLARDRWSLIAPAVRAYQRETRAVIRPLAQARRWLDDIKALAGPDDAALGSLSDAIATASRRLAPIVPPAELQPAHALLASALALAAHAVRVRRAAVGSGSVQKAWDASAAAAGSLMLLARARAQTESLLTPPVLR